MVTLEDFTLDQTELPYHRQQRLGLRQRVHPGSAVEQDHPTRPAGDVAGRDQRGRLRRRQYQLDNTPPRIILQHHPGGSGADRRHAGAAPLGRQSAEGHQHARPDSVRSLQEHVLPGADGRMGGSADGRRARGIRPSTHRPSRWTRSARRPRQTIRTSRWAIRNSRWKIPTKMAKRRRFTSAPLRPSCW